MPTPNTEPAFWSLHQPTLGLHLRALTEAETLPALQAQLTHLQTDLANPASSVHTAADNGDVVLWPAERLQADLAQVATAYTLDRAKYYLRRLIKSMTEVKANPINDLNLNRWKDYSDIYTDSLWVIDRRENSGVHQAGYWGNFIPQIPYQLMRRYTKKGEWVLDPFAGSGTTFIEGQRLGRHVLGTELQPAMVATAGSLIAGEANPHHVSTEIVAGDAGTFPYGELLAKHGRQTVQLVILHPPYFDIIKFSADTQDLSNAPSLTEFLASLRQVVKNVAGVLEENRFLALVIGDKYVRGEWIPLGFLAMQEVQQEHFLLKSIVVKNFEETTGKRQQKDLWRYRALAGGFYLFKHEYIFIFQKTLKV